MRRTESTRRIETLCVDTIRTLVMDAVQRADSGHPGAAMAMAPVAYTLFEGFLRFDPQQPSWPNRDRFVLSMGHASMLLYATLHLTGYDVTLEDIRQFRQLHGKCAGHPEVGLAPGVETTTGPLGQGVGNSVGMAVAGKWLADHFNRPGYELFDYRVFALCGDGDMMEGVSGEAASLAGHLGLDNLIWLYDDNHITIDGTTALTFSEDVGRRFEAYGWFVQRVADANDLDALRSATQRAVEEPHRPSIIVVRSHIAYGSPNKQDTAAAHGAPLGPEEVRATKRVYGWDPDVSFHVPDEVPAHLGQRVRSRGVALRESWTRMFQAYADDHSELANQWNLMQSGKLPEGWADDLPAFEPEAKGLATRRAGGKVLNAIAGKVPWLLGGSADLGASNKTLVGDGDAFARDRRGGRNLYFGIREHAMGAMANGMSLCGLRPYAATFLVFSDYMRPAIRLAAMMGQPVIYVFTHDSIAVGEDGPTHQPIEQLATLRVVPNLDVIRPADAAETVIAWRQAVETRDHPVALVLTRQAVPMLDRSRLASAERARRGAYVLAEADGDPQVILIGTGSEVHLCLAARDVLSQEGVATRVVSMPCQEVFDRQDQAYRQAVLPPGVPARVAVEAGVSQGWAQYGAPAGAVVGCEDFGTSAPADQAMIECGLTAEAVVATARQVLSRTGG